MRSISQDSLALMALSSRILPSEVPALRASELWPLLEKVDEPSKLFGLDSGTVAELTGLPSSEAQRVQRRLDAGVGLAVRLQSLLEMGIVPVTAVDYQYPHRLRQRLNRSAPPVLYCAGDVSILSQDGIGVVGSRDIGPETVEVAQSIGSAVALASLALVSGGAKGVDRISMGAALEAGGTAVGVLADSLERAISRSDNRRIVLEGVACLCTPYSPDAGFSAGNAMGRNKIIYGLSKVTVVVASSHGEGGTWAGATEALKKRISRVAVWTGPGAGPGNEPLVQAGAVAVEVPESVIAIHALDPHATTAPDQMQLAFVADSSPEPSPERIGGRSEAAHRTAD